MSIREFGINRIIFMVLIIMGLFVLPSYVMAQNNYLKLYQPAPTTKMDDVVSILEKDTFQQAYPSIGRTSFEEDTLVIYQKEYQRVDIGYCPKSKIVYDYRYEWNYYPTIDDDFIIKESKKESNLIQSKTYFFSILDSLKILYGEPKSIYIHDGYGYTIVDEKSKLDTLNYNNLFSSHCFFEIYWVDTDKRITLGFDNTANVSMIKYGYYNIRNHNQKNEEIASNKNKELLIKIGWWTLGIILASIFVYFIVREYRKNAQIEEELAEIRQRKEEERLEKIRKEEEEKEKQKLLQLEVIKTEHKKYVSNLVEKYGVCDKTIQLSPKQPYSYNEILVFSQMKFVVIAQKEFSFSDILDCTVNDDIIERETVHTYRGTSIATSKADTGSMVGRAIVGGVLLGGAGAVIGGSTAKRNTVIEHGTDTSVHNKEIEHNYKVAITVKDIANPIIYLNVGSNAKLKDEIVSLMKVIMSMK